MPTIDIFDVDEFPTEYVRDYTWHTRVRVSWDFNKFSVVPTTSKYGNYFTDLNCVYYQEFWVDDDGVVLFLLLESFSPRTPNVISTMRDILFDVVYTGTWDRSDEPPSAGA